MRESKKSTVCAFLFSFIFLFLSVPLPAENTPDAPKRILYVNSYDSSYQWFNDVFAGFYSYFTNLKYPIRIDSIELGYQNRGGSGKNEALLLSLIRNGDYDLILASGNYAVELLQKNSSRFPNLPCVFCGYREQKPLDRKKYPNFAGVKLADLTESNLKLGTKLFPRLQKVVLLFNDSASGVIYNNAVINKLKKLKKPDIVCLSRGKCSRKQMEKTLADLPKNSLILYTGWRASNTSELEYTKFFGEKIARITSAPLLTIVSKPFSGNLLGGIMMTGEDHGKDAAEIVHRIFTGTKPAMIPIRTAKPKTIFDAGRLRKYNVALSELPPDAILYNIPETFFQKNYPWILIGSIAVLAILLCYSLYQFMRSRYAKQLKTIFDTTPVRIMVVDANEKILFFQKSEEMEYGLPKPPCTLQDLPQPVPDLFRPLIQDCLKTGTPYRNVEYDLFGKRRQADILRLKTSVFGKPAVQCISRDITESYIAQERLKIQNMIWQQAAETANLGYFLCDSAGQQVYSSMSERFWKTVDGRKLSAEEWLIPEDRDRFIAAWKKLLNNEVEKIDVNYASDYTGSRKYYAMHVLNVPQSLNTGSKYFGIIQDVTQAREQEFKHHNTSILLQNIIDNLPCALFVKDVENDFTYVMCSSIFSMITNCPKEEITGKNDYQLFPIREEVEVCRKGDQEAVDSGKPCDSKESVLGFNGIRYTMRILKNVYKRADGHRLLLCIATDISAQVEAEKKLMETNELLQTIIDNLPCALWVKNFTKDDTFVLSNRYHHQLVGCKEGTMVGKTDRDFHREDMAEKYREDDAKALETPEGIECDEVQISPDGTKRTIHTRKLPLHTGNNGDRLVLGISFDVTELIRSRDELQKSNGILNAMLDNLPACIFVKDPDNEFKYLIWNRAAEKVTGLKTAKVVGSTLQEIARHSTINPAFFHKDDLDLLAGKPIDKEIIFISPQEETFFFRMKKTLIPLENGSNLILALAFDITDQKMIEQKLTSSTTSLQAYIEQERLISGILEAVVRSDDDEKAIASVLEIIGEKVGADHCYIFSFDYEAGCLRPVAEWCPPETERNLYSLPEFKLSPEDPWFKEFEKKRPFIAEDLEDRETLDGIGNRKDYFETDRIKSMLGIGLWKNDQLWGHFELSYTSSKHIFSDRDKKLLQAAAHIIEIILERQRSRTQLEQSEYEKEQILDNIDMPILLFDDSKQLVRVNPAAKAIYGLDRNNRKHGDPFCEPPGESADCPVRKTLQTHSIQRLNLTLHERNYIVTTKPIFDKSGKLIFVLENAIEITELKRQHDELLAAMETAKAADRAKSHFLATISHELRTPLNAVIGYSELLMLGGISPEEQQESLKAINFAGNTLLKLVNDVLDLSKLEAGQVKLVQAPLDLSKLINEIIQVFLPECRKRGNTLTANIPGHLPELCLDQLRLRQILLNLVGNAVKFTENGKIEIDIRFTESADQTSDTLEISISDTGIGISQKMQRIIFEPFRQDDGETRGNKVYEGTGLGLSISKRLVTRMGGKIILKSTPGEGSTFTVILKNTVNRKHAGKPAEAAPAALEVGPVIMLVDDEPMNLELLSAMLKHLEIRFVTCTSASEALDMVKEIHPDLILTDLWMPGMNGDLFAEKVAAIPAAMQIPVIAVTADTQLRLSRTSPFKGILYKPISLEKVRHLLNEHNIVVIPDA